MTEAVQIELQTADDQQNPAVARCCHAWQAAYDHAVEYDAPEYKVREAARDAFRNAMPPLVGRQNIRDFIACVACGLLRGLILDMEVPRLLYAAQIAVSADGSSRAPRRAEG